jgi:peptidoglycan LD-endopeptidase LytH
MNHFEINTEQLYALKSILRNIEKSNLTGIDLSQNNKQLKHIDLKNTEEFTKYINDYLLNKNAAFAIGGYNEYREIYRRSSHFQQETEERSIHLGLDIWSSKTADIYSPFDGVIHSFKNNTGFGDYGPTIVVKHNNKGQNFHLLYGHLSIKSLEGLKEGMNIKAGEKIAELGNPSENGNWPIHLHLQAIKDMKDLKGDYPGVCKMSEQMEYLKNCPNPIEVLMI